MRKGCTRTHASSNITGGFSGERVPSKDGNSYVHPSGSPLQTLCVSWSNLRKHRKRISSTTSSAHASTRQIPSILNMPAGRMRNGHLPLRTILMHCGGDASSGWRAASESEGHLGRVGRLVAGVDAVSTLTNTRERMLKVSCYFLSLGHRYAYTSFVSYVPGLARLLRIRSRAQP